MKISFLWVFADQSFLFHILFASVMGKHAQRRISPWSSSWKASNRRISKGRFLYNFFDHEHQENDQENNNENGNGEHAFNEKLIVGFEKISSLVEIDNIELFLVSRGAYEAVQFILENFAAVGSSEALAEVVLDVDARKMLTGFAESHVAASGESAARQKKYKFEKSHKFENKNSTILFSSSPVFCPKPLFYKRDPDEIYAEWSLARERIYSEDVH